MKVTIEQNDWTPFKWHCPNCGALVNGYKDNIGTIKVECGRCHVVMIRTLKGSRHDTLEIFAPVDHVRKTC